MDIEPDWSLSTSLRRWRKHQPETGKHDPTFTTAKWGRLIVVTDQLFATQGVYTVEGILPVSNIMLPHVASRLVDAGLPRLVDKYGGQPVKVDNKKVISKRTFVSGNPEHKRRFTRWGTHRTIDDWIVRHAFTLHTITSDQQSPNFVVRETTQVKLPSYYRQNDEAENVPIKHIPLVPSKRHQFGRPFSSTERMARWAIQSTAAVQSGETRLLAPILSVYRFFNMEPQWFMELDVTRRNGSEKPQF